MSTQASVEITGHRTDVLIVTTLQLEYEAIVSMLPHGEQVHDATSGLNYVQAQLAVADTSRDLCDVVALRRSDLGIGGDRDVFEAIQTWNPSLTIFVGIAAGVSTRLGLGDVLVADRVIWQSPSKSISEGPSLRQTTANVDASVLAAVREFATRPWQEKLLQRDLAVRPEVHIGPIASVNSLIVDRSQIEMLKASTRGLLAVEMEGAGIGVAAEAPRSPLVIRCVAELATGSKDNSWRALAAEIAAVFTVGLIKSPNFPSPSSQRERVVTLTIEGEFTSERSEELIQTLSQILKISPAELSLRSVRRG